MTEEYNDIIDLPHYEPKQHPRMSLRSRAAQFAPFAALTGHDAAIKDTADSWIEEQEKLPTEDGGDW